MKMNNHVYLGTMYKHEIEYLRKMFQPTIDRFRFVSGIDESNIKVVIADNKGSYHVYVHNDLLAFYIVHQIPFGEIK